MDTRLLTFVCCPYSVDDIISLVDVQGEVKFVCQEQHTVLEAALFHFECRATFPNVGVVSVLDVNFFEIEVRWRRED